MCRFSTRQQQGCWTWLAVTPAPAQPSPAPHRADGQPTSPCRPDHPPTTPQTRTAAILLGVSMNHWCVDTSPSSRGVGKLTTSNLPLTWPRGGARSRLRNTPHGTIKDDFSLWKRALARRLYATESLPFKRPEHKAGLQRVQGYFTGLAGPWRSPTYSVCKSPTRGLCRSLRWSHTRAWPCPPEHTPHSSSH